MQSGLSTSSRETAVSLLVLIVLALIAAGIYLKQSDFNPALRQAQPPSAASQAAQASPGDPAPAPADAEPAPPLLDLAALAAPELTVMSEPETFTPATLSDKIDGKAELYLAAGVVGMTCQRLQVSEEDWLEVSAYDMAEHRNAFAVYSSQQRPGSQKLATGQFAYRSSNTVCLVQGKWYVEVVAFTTAPPLLAAMEAYAGRLAASLAGAGHPQEAMDELSLLPDENLVPESKMLATEADFGVTGFSEVFLASYDLEGQRVSVFLARRSDADAASKAAADYIAFFVPFGATSEPAPAGLEGAAAVEMFGIHKVAFARGRFVAGVHQANSSEAAAAGARLIEARLSRASKEAP